MHLHPRSYTQTLEVPDCRQRNGTVNQSHTVEELCSSSSALKLTVGTQTAKRYIIVSAILCDDGKNASLLYLQYYVMTVKHDIRPSTKIAQFFFDIHGSPFISLFNLIFAQDKLYLKTTCMLTYLLHIC
jgi:hypothetical protein